MGTEIHAKLVAGLLLLVAVAHAAPPPHLNCVDHDLWLQITDTSASNGLVEIRASRESQKPLLPKLDRRIRTVVLGVGGGSCGVGGAGTIACYSDVCMLIKFYDWDGKELDVPGVSAEIAFTGLPRHAYFPGRGYSKLYDYRLELRDAYNGKSHVIEGSYELWPGLYCRFHPTSPNS